MLTATPRDHWLRGLDLNQRPSGYEPDELPLLHPAIINIMTLSILLFLSHQFIIKMAEEEGFEPPRGLTRLSVFKTDPFSRTWVFLRYTIKVVDLTGLEPVTGRL